MAAENLPINEKIDQIKTVLLTFQDSRPVVENQISQMMLETDTNSSDLEFYEILQQKSLTLQKRTADIIRLLRVDEKTVNQDIG